MVLALLGDMRLEDLTPGTTVRGILPDATVSVVSVQWHGSDALTLVYRNPAGRVADEILYRHDEARLEIVEQGRPWSFDGEGALFHLVADGAGSPTRQGGSGSGGSAAAPTGENQKSAGAARGLVAAPFRPMMRVWAPTSLIKVDILGKPG
jgi:hypothetical protein